MALLQAIYRAILTSPESIPNTEFSFSISDWADPDHLNKTIWSLSRLASQEQKWAMSDFGYFSWPMNGLIGSYEQVRAKISEREPTWEDKINKALWRGLVKNNAKRKDLINVAQGKEWSDIRGVEWTNAKTLTKASQKYAVSMVDHCAYRYLVGTEGIVYFSPLL
jgi:Glycosyl transferase family 90